MEWRTGRRPSWAYRTPLDTEKDAEFTRNKVITFGRGACKFCREPNGEVHKKSCIHYDPIPDVLIRAASPDKLTGDGLIW